MSPLHRITLLGALCSVALLPSVQAASKPKPSEKPKPAAVADPVPPVAEPVKEGKIVGVPITRSNGTFLGLRVEGGVFVLAFYDAKKNPMRADAIRASSKWNPPQKAGNVYGVMALGGDGTTLVGNKTVTPPYILKVFISLFGADDKLIESFVVDHRQMP